VRQQELEAGPAAAAAGDICGCCVTCGCCVACDHCVTLHQKLDKDDVAAMRSHVTSHPLFTHAHTCHITRLPLRRSSTTSGGDIVGKLVEGSATFEGKTGFSKAKYIRKKMQKHVHTVRVLQPTAFNMAQVCCYTHYTYKP